MSQPGYGEAIVSPRERVRTLRWGSDSGQWHGILQRVSQQLHHEGKGNEGPADTKKGRRVNKHKDMRVLLQRVSSASVTINGQVVGTIGRGFCVLVGFTHEDTPAQVNWMAEKVAGLRLFNDPAGKMNLGLDEAGGAVLVVSQFTLYGDASKGRRPSFIDAARPEVAIPLYERFIAVLRERGLTVAAGEFGADMQVEIHNDGPVTLFLDRTS
jgi:D-aminoacyl-tRNA deacylase